MVREKWVVSKGLEKPREKREGVMLGRGGVCVWPHVSRLRQASLEYPPNMVD